MKPLRPTLGRLKRTFQVAVSLAICFALYRAADWRAVAASLVELDRRWLFTGLALFVPQTLVSAWRWRRMTADVAIVTMTESLRHTLAASALNLVVPSKLGDFSKAAFVPVAESGARRRLAVLVGVEKIADLAALFVVMLSATRGGWPAVVGMVAFLLAALVGNVLRGVPRRMDLRFVRMLVGPEVQPTSRRNATEGVPYRVFAMFGATALLWTLHLAQIHYFLLAAAVPTSWTMTMARVPPALLAGVVPAAFCGIGTRDAALVWLFADVAPAATMAVVGLLTALRYVVPGVIGIPLLLSLRQPASAATAPTARSANRRRRLRPAATVATP